MADEPSWIFGLAIDDELTWGAVQVEDGASRYSLKDDILYGTLPGLGITERDGLHEFVRDSLVNLKHANPIMKDIFSKAVAIGVCTIGLADHSKLRLTSIARKEWVNSTSGEYILDFRSLFKGMFGKTIENSIHQSEATKEVSIAQIAIHNDATAKCLAEYYWQDANDRVDSLSLVMISEGVNGGSVFNKKPLETELHPEIGHIYPRLHKNDTGFNIDYTGCPIHQYCFEGVASGARIRKEWAAHRWSGPGPKPVLPPQSDPVWDIIAYYIAQICWDSSLFLPSQRILVAGPYIFDTLMDNIREYFQEFNAGNFNRKRGRPLDKPYLRYDAMNRPDFIRPAKLQQYVGVLGALELARHKAAGSDVVLPFGQR